MLGLGTCLFPGLEEAVDKLYVEERERRVLTFYVLGGDRQISEGQDLAILGEHATTQRRFFFLSLSSSPMIMVRTKLTTLITSAPKMAAQKFLT